MIKRISNLIFLKIYLHNLSFLTREDTVIIMVTKFKQLNQNTFSAKQII